MQVGFIGTGSMGSILIEAFIEAHALLPSQIIASNRTREKVEKLASRFPGLQVATDNQEVVQNSNIFLICVKPLEYKKVLDEIKDVIRPAQILISITSPVFIEELEQNVSCKIAKVIPSITNLVQSGSSLVMFSERCNQKDKESILRLFSNISQPIEIDEKVTRVSSDISSCGPAFFSFILQKFIDAAVEETNISRSEAVFLTSQMIKGFGKLLAEEKFTLETLQQRVCVPGGVTGAGIQVLEREFGDIFNQLFHTTHEKYREDLNNLDRMFHKL
ncbi:MAG: late competence protein ComER [Bacillaceae bacterium]|nr:late competence protein ComER [Bacillaceae bacterium]